MDDLIYMKYKTNSKEYNTMQIGYPKDFFYHSFVKLSINFKFEKDLKNTN